MATSDAPISIGQVSLTVNNLDQMGDYYQSILGLQSLQKDGETMLLGCQDRPLLELRQDRHAAYRPNEAGLFHNAFLLPERADLGRWLLHASNHGIQLTGATDHCVSEALYMRDPEGNGIEIYVDRPSSMWTFHGDEVDMRSRSFDLQALTNASPGTWQGAPEGTVIGHVHLQVGDVLQADEFYRDQIGLKRTSHRPDVSFYASGEYHHHLAGNIWNSKGAGLRSKNTTGLAVVELLVSEESAVLSADTTLLDPWGTQFSIRCV